MPAHEYVEENGLAAMLAAKRLAGVSTEVNLSEFATCMLLPNVNKAVTLALKHTGNVSRKQRYEWHPPKFKKKHILDLK